MRKNNFMVFLTVMGFGFMGCSSQQSAPKEKLPPKCDTKEIREAAVEYDLHAMCKWNGPEEELECIKDRTKDSVLDIEWKEDLGILAGTKTRVCKDGKLAYHYISGEYKGKTYRPNHTSSYMFYYDTDGKLVVKDWVKGEEN